MLLSDDKDLADTLTCATCIDVTPTMFFINHFAHSAPVKMRTPELTIYSIIIFSSGSNVTSHEIIPDMEFQLQDEQGQECSFVKRYPESQ